MSRNLSRAVVADVSPTTTERSVPSIRPASPTALWICLYFPTISLDAVEATGSKNERPILIVEHAGERQIVHTACSLALENGVMAGMPLNAAHALCEKPRIILRSQEKELALLELYTQALSQYTPIYSLIKPDTVLLEVSGSAKLFGGIEALYRTVRQRFSGRTLTTLSPSPSASRLLAHTGNQLTILNRDQLKQALSTIQIQDTDIPTKTKSQLMKCGILTLGDLWRLPRPDLARRFGMNLVTMMDKLLGVEPDPQQHGLPKLSFSSELTLHSHNDNKAVLALAAQQLLVKAQCFLKQHSSVVEAVRFELLFEKLGANETNEATHTELIARSQQASHNPDRFLPQFESQLAQQQLTQSVAALVLTLDDILPASRFSDDLFAPRRRDSLDWSHLMDIITTRLGNEALYGIECIPDHRPEYAWKQRSLQHPLSSPLSKQKPSTDNIPKDLLNSRRPLWLLKKPKFISSNQLTPNSIPDIERIESGWWESKRGVRRDYHVVKIDKGPKAWTFVDLKNRDTQPTGEAPCSVPCLPEASAMGWYLHGLFG